MRFLLAVSMTVVALFAGQAHAERRVALVIGNSAYADVPALRNPRNDAEELEKSLVPLGFEVIRAEDLTGDGLVAAVDKFSDAIVGADVALFYYSGHAMQLGDRNLLLPVDFRAKTELEARRQSLELSQVIAHMEARAKVNLVFLDACRDNPLAAALKRTLAPAGRSASVGRGLAIEPAGVNTMIVFATAPGTQAADGSGRNSPFTEAVLENIASPGIEIETMMKRVTDKVATATSGDQVPERLSKLRVEFYFSPASLPDARQNADISEEMAFWRQIEGSSDPRDFETYLSLVREKRFSGVFSVLATAKAKQLKAAELSIALLDFKAAGDALALIVPEMPRRAVEIVRPEPAFPSPTACDGSAATPSIANCEASLSKDPDNKHLLANLATIHASERRFQEAAKLFSKAAFAGDASSMYSLGILYEKGFGVSKDPREAVLWYERASNAGYSTAMVQLASLYQLGEGVDKNPDIALSWYKAAVEAGEASAMKPLGDMYSRQIPDGGGEAASWYLKAASIGDPAAMFELGTLLLEGKVVGKDTSKAVEWLTKAAEKGNSASMLVLGILYDRGIDMAADPVLAVQWYRRAAALGNGPAAARLGVLFLEGTGVEKDERAAFEWFAKAAGTGVPEAMVNLGYLYNHGIGVDQDDNEAYRWYWSAAEEGNAVGMLNVGILYETGVGVKKDVKEASAWYRRAADLGDVSAMNNLANHLARGDGGHQSTPVEAYALYLRGAKQGNGPSMYNLANLYAFGFGTDKDRREARRWYERAADAGIAEGTEKARQLGDD